MAEKTNARTAAPRERSHGRTQTDAAPSAQPASDSLFGLQRDLGNQTVLRLFESGLLQAKLRVSQPGDADEEEADRIADQVVSRQRAPMVQRKCACEGGAPCAKCAGEQEDEVIHRSDASLHSFPLSLQRAAAVPAQQEEGTPASAGRPPALIADDDAKSLGSGQMRKTEFLEQLRAAACATADAVLAAVGHSTKACPYIAKWLNFYESSNAQHLERALLKYAPEARRARTAREYISIVNRHVQRATLEWARTGKVTGLPDEIQAQLAGAGGGFLARLNKFASTGVTGAVLGFFAGGSKKESSKAPDVQRKPKEGSDAGNTDVADVRGQLGAGRALDSRVQSQMSLAFGYDFSSVRVHADAEGAKLSSQLDARAFAIGNDVAFAAGEYKPGTLIGDALIAHELAHVVQQSGGQQTHLPMRKSEGASRSLEAEADQSAVTSLLSFTGILGSAKFPPRTAAPTRRASLRLQRCKSERQKEIEQLGGLQYSFMEEKRKAEEERQRKEAEEDAKKKGLPPPPTPPKVELGEVIKKEEGAHALKGSPTTEWDTADQPAWRKRAEDAWKAVLASVKGTELEAIAKGVTFNFDPKAALEGGFYASQHDHTLTVGMSWVKFAEMDPRNVWENLAHEMAGHFKYGTTYAQEIMESALSKLSSADRARFTGDSQKFFETYEYPETEIYASLWQRRYRVPVSGEARPSGGIHPDLNIDNKLRVMKDVLQPEVAKAVLKELKRRVDANDQILQRDKDFLVKKIKDVFGYDL